MNKTAQTEYFRLFLIDSLPEPLLPKSAHLQLFDNYIENTRIRLRIVRDPQTKGWTRILQQRIDLSERSVTKLSEIYLNEAEYAAFERFEGREIRKNRYFHEFDGREITFDVYMGDMWGLHTARVDFETAEERDAYEPPPFAVFEVTGEGFFSGWNLVEKKFADIQAEVAKLETLTPAPAIAAQE
jgi:CYTH domain-containing protein